MNHRVSVVIPTFNRALDLAKALDSVLQQTYSEWEILVIDNRSADCTYDVVQRLNDKRIRYFEIENKGVIAASRNLGISQSNGEFIAFLDSDDRWRREKLKESVFWLGRGYDIVYHDMDCVTNKRCYLGPRKFSTRQVEPPVYIDLLVNGNTLPTSSVVARKDVLVKAGCFNEAMEMIAGEDYELWLRLGTLTERFKRIDGTLGYLTRGSDNEFTSRRVMSFLAEIEKKHIALLLPTERDLAFANWIDYAYGRSRYTQKDYVGATGHLIRALTSSNNLSSRIKAMYMLIAIVIRKAIGYQTQESGEGGTRY